MTFITRFFNDDSGSNALEYGLIVALVSLAIVAGATTAGGALNTVFVNLGARLNTIAAGIVTPAA
jgi:pilus assembly protein Flp/PilA